VPLPGTKWDIVLWEHVVLAEEDWGLFAGGDGFVGGAGELVEGVGELPEGAGVPCPGTLCDIVCEQVVLVAPLFAGSDGLDELGGGAPTVSSIV